MSFNGSKQRYRIPIDGGAEIGALRHGEPLGEIPGDLGELARIAGFEEEVPTPATFDAIDGAGRGADDLELTLEPPNESIEPGSGGECQLRRRGFRRAAEHHVRDANERRVDRSLAPLELVAYERVIVVRH